MSKKKADKPLSAFEIRAMTVLKEKGPLWTACVGEEIWPDKKFRSRQGAALAGGGLMGRLRVRGLVDRKYDRLSAGSRLRFLGWALTPKGIKALSEAGRQVGA